MRKHFLVVPALLALAGLSAACAGDRTPTAAATQAPAARFNGEQLFRGIYFGQGEAGNALPEIWAEGKSAEAHAHNAAELAEVRHQIDAIVAKVNAQDPRFFDRFAADVRSGDRLRIQGAVDQGATMLLKAIDTKNVKPSDLLGVYPCVTVWLAIDYVVAAQVAAVVEVALLWDRSPTEGATLQREQVVDMIATRFGNHMQIQPQS